LQREFCKKYFTMNRHWEYIIEYKKEIAALVEQQLAELQPTVDKENVAPHTSAFYVAKTGELLESVQLERQVVPIV
jgi:hypothetical protein